MSFGDYKVYKHGTLIDDARTQTFHTCKGLTYMIATSPWFSTKYTEDNDVTIEDMLEYWYENRDNIPYHTVEEFVTATNGKIVQTGSVAINDGSYYTPRDSNACGLISLFNRTHFKPNMHTTDYRKQLTGSGSLPGQMISEDQLGEIAKRLNIKIYFVHASREGYFSVIIAGDHSSRKYVVIHSMGNHFERISWD